MVAVTMELTQTAVVGMQTTVLAVMALVVLSCFKLDSAWVVLGEGIGGMLVWPRGAVASEFSVYERRDFYAKRERIRRRKMLSRASKI